MQGKGKGAHLGGTGKGKDSHITKGQEKGKDKGKDSHIGEGKEKGKDKDSHFIKGQEKGKVSHTTWGKDMGKGKESHLDKGQEKGMGMDSHIGKGKSHAERDGLDGRLHVDQIFPRCVNPELKISSDDFEERRDWDMLPVGIVSVRAHRPFPKVHVLRFLNLFEKRPAVRQRTTLDAHRLLQPTEVNGAAA